VLIFYPHNTILRH